MVGLLPETAERSTGSGLRLMRLGVPERTRPSFVSTAVLGFAGFAVLGLFTAVTPTIAVQVLHLDDVLAVAGLICSLYVGSALGQLPSPGSGRRPGSGSRWPASSPGWRWW